MKDENGLMPEFTEEEHESIRKNHAKMLKIGSLKQFDEFKNYPPFIRQMPCPSEGLL